ncbi:MAG: 50S ribosomal protein L7ae [Promethearchaeota archaeon]|nr:MAG: 50S ribosomal protein L7ae [Candidatus Lokiarchaeota archaeon]
MSYVKFKIPDKIKDQILSVLKTIADTRDSRIRIGMNETTKCIERGLAKLVVMAEDVSPPEILYHIPLLCDEKKIPYAYVSGKKALGKAVKINVSSSAIAVEDLGSGNEKVLDDIKKKLEELKK